PRPHARRAVGAAGHRPRHPPLGVHHRGQSIAASASPQPPPPALRAGAAVPARAAGDAPGARGDRPGAPPARARAGRVAPRGRHLAGGAAMRRLAVAVVAVLSAGAFAQTGGTLPPGHPSVAGAGAAASSSAGTLPPGHPSVGGAGAGASSSTGTLPPGHPSVGEAPAAMPPGHPPMRDGASPPSADELLKRLDA